MQRRSGLIRGWDMEPDVPLPENEDEDRAIG